MLGVSDDDHRPKFLPLWHTQIQKSKVQCTGGLIMVELSPSIFLYGAKWFQNVLKISENMQVSNNKEELEKKADFKVMGSNAIQQQSKFAKGGNTRFAQAFLKNCSGKSQNSSASTFFFQNKTSPAGTSTKCKTMFVLQKGPLRGH